MMSEIANHHPGQRSQSGRRSAKRRDESGDTMGGFMKQLVTLFILILLGSCAPTYTIPKAAVPSSSKTIAVVAAFAEEFQLSAAGLGAFGNSNDRADITDWNLDKLAVDIAGRTLSSRFQVIQAPISISLEKNTEKEIVDELRTVPTTNRPDLVLVLWVNPKSDICIATSPMSCAPFGYRGIGVTKVWSPTGPNPINAHIFLRVTLIDTRDNTVITSTKLVRPCTTTEELCKYGPLFPMKAPSAFAWADKWTELSREDQQRARTAIEELLSESLPYTLTEMGLGS